MRIIMLTLDQYIDKRKQEDKLDEFDVSKKVENIQICINYIFEYFNQYLPLQGAENRTPDENRLLQKYTNEIEDYSNETQEWLRGIYCETGHRMNRILENYLYSHIEFFFAYQESEFRSISYNCYAELIKKRQCLKNNTEELYRFIRECHEIKCQYEPGDIKISLSQDIIDWIEKTWDKYEVNIYLAVDCYVNLFMNNKSLWPPGTRIETGSTVPRYMYRYDYSKRNNRFNINRFYSMYGNRPFLRGKKRQLELLMLCNWAGENDDAVKEFLIDNPSI